MTLEETKNIEELLERMYCKLCMENEATWLMYPCMHMCYCYECLQKLEMCMICKSTPTSFMKVFKS